MSLKSWLSSTFQPRRPIRNPRTAPRRGRPALEALEGFSHAIVVFHLDRVPEAARRLSVPVGADGALVDRGVLATRSQLRPNPIGVSVVRIVLRRKAVLRVRGLDALDGTPVLDLKPYLPPYDAVPDAKLPDWAVG